MRLFQFFTLYLQRFQINNIYMTILIGMKKNVMKVAMMAMALMVTTSAHAQFDLGSIAGKVLGTATSSSENSSTGDLVSTLTTVFSSDKQANKNNIVGTWVYDEPAIVLTSGNFLSNAAYKIAANTAEKKLQKYLTKYGFASGTFSITFNEDGTCSETLKGKTFKGNWQIENEKLVLSISGVRALSITTQISGSEMQVVTDATKLLTLFKSFGSSSGSSELKTISSLLKGAKEMQLGLTLKKQ